MITMYLSNVGLIQVPSNIDKIFSSDGKFIISPTLNEDYYFEMSGESMYYAIKYIERQNGVDLSVHKKRILNAVIKRIEMCDGKLFHKSLSGIGFDTQLRSSSAAIRILIEAIDDGFNDYYTLSCIVNYHYQFFFKWAQGIWFCHDTSEFNDRGPKSHIQTTILKTERKNTLTLNTHFDSLSTLLLLEPYAGYLNLSFPIKDYIESAILSMQYLLEVDENHSIMNKFIQRIDCKLLNINIIYDNIITKLYERIIHPILFKIISPTIFFEYGFIGRDIAVLNRHIDYHIVNMVDIARVLCLLRNSDYIYRYNDLYNSYVEVLKMGITISNRVPNYNSYIHNGELNIAWLCELSVLLHNLQITCPFNTDCYDYPKYNPFSY